MFFGNFRDGTNVGKIQQRVTDGFNEDSPGFFGNSSFKASGVTGIGPPCLNTELGQNTVKHGIGPAVKIIGRDNFIACRADIDDRIVNCGGA